MSILESQFAWLPKNKTQFAALTNLAILMLKLKYHNEFESLTTSVEVMRDDSQIWRHVSPLIIDEKPLEERTPNTEIVTKTTLGTWARY